MSSYKGRSNSTKLVLGIGPGRVLAETIVELYVINSVACRGEGVHHHASGALSLVEKYSRLESAFDHWPLSHEIGRNPCSCRTLWALWQGYCLQSACSCQNLKRPSPQRVSSLSEKQLSLTTAVNDLLLATAVQNVHDFGILSTCHGHRLAGGSPCLCSTYSRFVLGLSQRNIPHHFENLGLGYFGAWIAFVQILYRRYTPLQCSGEGKCGVWNRQAEVWVSASSIISCLGDLGSPSHPPTAVLIDMVTDRKDLCRALWKLVISVIVTCIRRLHTPNRTQRQARRVCLTILNTCLYIWVILQSPPFIYSTWTGSVSLKNWLACSWNPFFNNISYTAWSIQWIRGN